MKQLALFDAAPEGGPVCSFGRPSPVDPAWSGPHHCAGCAAATDEARRQFAADVAAGKYNARGYTRSEWIRAGHPASTWRQ